MKKAMCLVLLLLVGCRPVVREESPRELARYFPLVPGLVQVYAGEGNEYAPFVREFTFVQENVGQVHDDNGGALVIRVFQVRENEVAIIGMYPETEDTSDRIGQALQAGETLDIILRSPLQAGTTWESQGREREILSISETLDLPAGQFTDVVWVRTRFPESQAVLDEYYAPDVGLLRRVYIDPPMEVDSYLESMEQH